MSLTLPGEGRQRTSKPEWLKVKAPGSPGYLETREIIKSHSLNTVCEEARCPNAGECWSHHTATFMIMGEYCTRRCHFCSVQKGTEDTLEPLDPLEPARVASAARRLGLRHIVVTSVDRDDLSDNGAQHFARTVRAIRAQVPQCSIEILIGDLQGNLADLETILSAHVEILNHNLETVARLYRKVRPVAEYQRSLKILREAKILDPSVITKSGIMVGLGETYEEVLALMDDLREASVDIMTIGQYLRPTEKQAPVKAYITPSQFREYELAGLARGFKFVESGPLVRSSYHAWKHSPHAGSPDSGPSI